MSKKDSTQTEVLNDRLSTHSSSSREEIHINAVRYLEEKINILNKEKIHDINKVDELVDKAHNSSNVMLGLREAIDSLAQETNEKEIKLINFLEGFYQSAPITKSYTEEIHEKNFKAAVHYAFDIFNHEIEALGDLYHDYLEI